MSLRRPLAIALASSVALAGLVTATTTSAASGAAPAAKLQPRAATDDTTVWAAVLTLRSAGSGSSDIAVNGPDDTVYVIGGGDAAGEVDALSVINGTTGVLDDTYTLPGNGGLYIAVDQNDDTIYTSARPGPVGDYNGRTVQSRSPASPGTAVTDDTVPYAYVIAVNSQDDTVYVARTSGTGITFFSGRTPLSDDTRIVGGTTWAIAVDQSDDTVAMSFTTDDSVRFMAGATNALGSFIGGVGDQPSAIAINSPDDTIYVANTCPACTTVQVINGQTSAVGTPIYLPLFAGIYQMRAEAPRGLAVDDSTDTLFVAGTTTNRLGVINGANTDDSVYLSTGVGGAGGSFKSFQAFKSLAVDDSGTNQGLLWGVTYTGYVQAVTQVQPQLTGSTSGAAGAPVRFSVTPTSLTLPFLMSDNAVWGVRFNGSGSDIPATRVPGTNEWTATLPSGLPTGNVPVEVLFNGSQYAFAGNYTVQSSGPPPSYPPDPPTSVSAVAGDAQATVSWTAPSYAGSFPITDYMATSSPGGWLCIAKAPATSCTVSGLTNGVSYTFTAQALNGAGWSQASLPSSAVTPRAPNFPPGAPTDVAAVAGDARATVSWTAPSYAGSSAIADYEVVSSPGSRRCVVAAPATSCTVSGLTNGVSYTFTARAINAVGWGEASLPSSAVTPRAPEFPPGAPTSVSAVAGDARATVSWMAPSYAGTSPITGYEVVSSPGSRTCEVAASARTCTVEGLTNGVSYTFTVRAENEVGWGEASLPSSAVTPRAPEYPPGAPTSVSAVAGDAQATVSWMAPSYAGSSAITGYEVMSSPGSRTCEVAASARTCTVEGLTNGTSYTFTVRAENEVGWGEASLPSSAVTPRAPIVESILIVGSRDADNPRRVKVSGKTVGLVGEKVTPYVRLAGEEDFRARVGVQTVRADGTFDWQRKARGRVHVYFAHGSVRSETIVIPAR